MQAKPAFLLINKKTPTNGCYHSYFYNYNEYMKKGHYVYILLTERNTLYCGYTDNIEKRFQAHLEGRGAKYTRANKPVKIVFQQEFDTKQDALHTEYMIKKLSRAQKLELIKSTQNLIVQSPA